MSKFNFMKWTALIYSDLCLEQIFLNPTLSLICQWCVWKC